MNKDSVICFLGGPLSHDSPVVVFFDRGHSRFWNFYSTIPFDVVRVKSYINCFFDSARDPYGQNCTGEFNLFGVIFRILSLESLRWPLSAILFVCHM